MISCITNICTGCSACYSICPVQCISMKQDSEGFLYPFIEKEKCTKCKKCEEICPAIVQRKERKPLKVYAAKNPDEEIRRLSSSGGIFTLLAEHILHKGGVVFGVRFNETWEVIHDYTETIEGLTAFRGSKYVQSDIGKIYKVAKDFLLSDRKVLFTGTPCQLAGLKAFLQKDYDNLFTVDFVCHGVPSPLVWKKYLNEVTGDKKSRISAINFRDKNTGWKSYRSSVQTSQNADEDGFQIVESLDLNTYVKGFLRDLYLRPSCHNCPSKSFKSGTDITIADYWGIQNVLPEFDDDKGVSLVMANTEKGKLVYGSLNKICTETTYAQALAGNSMIEKSASITAKRAVFFEKWNNEPLIPLVNKLSKSSLTLRLKRLLKFCYRKFGSSRIMGASAIRIIKMIIPFLSYGGGTITFWYGV